MLIILWISIWQTWLPVWKYFNTILYNSVTQKENITQMYDTKFYGNLSQILNYISVINAGFLWESYYIMTYFCVQ